MNTLGRPTWTTAHFGLLVVAISVASACTLGHNPDLPLSSGNDDGMGAESTSTGATGDGMTDGDGVTTGSCRDGDGGAGGAGGAAPEEEESCE